MTGKYYKQPKLCCKHFNTIVGKLVGQYQFNQKTAYKGTPLAPTDIYSILQADFEKTQI